MHKIKKFFLFLFFILSLFFIYGCENSIVNYYIDNTLVKQDIIIDSNYEIYQPEDKDGYIFDGWYKDKELSIKYEEETINYSIDLYGKWDKEKYKITWINYDDSILLEEDYFIGEIPTYKLDLPIKEETDTESYEFSNWEPNITEVTNDITYEAVFNTIYKSNFNKEEVNSIFDNDIISYLPDIITIDYTVTNNSDDKKLEAVINLLDWDLNNYNNYKIEINKIEELEYDINNDLWYFDDYQITLKNICNSYQIIISKDITNFETLSNKKTINEFEKSYFNKSGLPSKGDIDVLVVPIEIKGYSFDSNYKEQLELVFNGNSLNTGWQSVSSFYQESSHNKLNLSFDIIDKYTTPNDKSYYQKKGTDGDQYAIKEALESVDEDINFNKYDSNNDDLIDSVIFIYSVSYSNEDPWWAWVYTAEAGECDGLTLDGVEFNYYMWASYEFSNDDITGNNNLIVNAETYIHETGHLMGMPDLYSTKTDYSPIGGWDMMDYNCADHGPMNKLLYGWNDPVAVSKDGEYDITLDSYSLDDNSTDNIILIPYNYTDLEKDNYFYEYLLIIFYTPNGLYSGHMNSEISLKKAGVIIYHVDARLNTNLEYWGEYFKQSNYEPSNNKYLVEILEADFNDSIPGSNKINNNDILESGNIDLSSYKWNQNSKNIDVEINILSDINNNSTNVDLEIIVG